ncbi:protein cordon-bleu [Sorex fumeus]|uniref:protein cordon-bleu n=1 Tax=Sorex fumeus TaxID=62283 RepID=UPI0024AE23D4|nr:protein cordon-bleu [Sorex fumeus]
MDPARAAACKPPSGRKIKARAPPPPGKATPPNVHSEQKAPRDMSPGPSPLLSVKDQHQCSMVDVTVVLPSGLEKRSMVSGSQAMMDLLVELCLQNHLNPSHHALEIRSSDTQQPLSFKPNTLVGTLDVHTIFLREKVPEEKVKTAPSRVPEKSVCLVVNYLRTQKAVVRVSPEVPLQNILPAICAKCDVSPENVVLLRDNIDGEELELSKSLNELGIKELYAWDNQRETFRKSSLGNDETEKEKKKFLGFFKVNKRSSSKAEPLGLSGAISDEDPSRSISGGLNGYLTMPNTPSSKSRSITPGPSLSLSNISGVSLKSDMKKRRAPPPPSQPAAAPHAQDRAPEKMSLGSQIDLQKKKRRAPAPPSPQPPPLTPVIPTRMEDKEEKRRSATGVGRLVPQKPPRGTSRRPPQLVLPPPPPYPPPDIDLADPLGIPGEGAVDEASDLRLTLSLPLQPEGHCSTDGVSSVPAEAEETVSVGSCFASEDTTEDSGVVSSLSDVISLDSQHDSTKSKDKWATDQEDCSDQDLAATPDPGPQRSPSWERSSSGNKHSRSEKVTVASNDDGDQFFVEQFQKTMADLDEDLEEKLQECYETDSSSLTNSINEVPSYSAQEGRMPNSDADAIPVTFIGEVLDDPVESGVLSNSNNNAGSSDTGSTSRRAPQSPDRTEQNQQLQAGRKKAEVKDSTASAHHLGKEIRLPLSSTCKDVKPSKVEHKATAASVLHTHSLKTKEQDRESDNGKQQGLERGTSRSSVQEKDGGNENRASAPPAWYQQNQSPGRCYGLKCGLTTYKIVPPKSDMKCYDRGVSLTTGAIKIDELGNLVSPHANRGRAMATKSPTLEEELQPIGKVKEFWRSNSVEKHSGRCTESWAKRSPVTTPNMAESNPRADPISPDPRVKVPEQHQPGQQENGKPMKDNGSQPPVRASGHGRAPAANVTEFPFPKPQRRTSSQYVASAIAKRIGPSKAPTQVVRKHDDVQKTHEEGVPELMGQPPKFNNSPTPRARPETLVHAHKDDARSPHNHLPSTNGEELMFGMHHREQPKNSLGKLSTQDNPSGTQRRAFVQPGTYFQNDNVSVGQSSGKPHASPHQVSSESDLKHLPGSQNPPPPPSEDQTLGRVLMNKSRQVPVSSEPPWSPAASNINGLARQETLQQEKKTNMSCIDVQETDDTLTSDIFGPKKKFKPVVQRPVPKDTSLHSALMEAIHSGGGKDRLRKTAEHTSEGKPKKPSYTESESEHSALMAAIRGHGGTCSLRKVSSTASEELQSFRDASLSTAGAESPRREDLGVHHQLPPRPPLLPAPQAPLGPLNNTADARQALLDAIRSGTGAARLRKVPLLV